MQDTISFTNALWLAAIPPTLGFVVVIVTLIVNANMNRSQTQEEAQRTEINSMPKRIGRDSIGRHSGASNVTASCVKERVGVYRDLIASAGAVLADSMNPQPGSAPSLVDIDNLL